MRLTALFSILAIACAMFVGCGDGGGTSTPSGGGSSGGTDGAGGGGKPKIAVIPKGTTHEFWKSIHAGARKAMLESVGGPNKEPRFEIIWRGPLKEDESEAQIKVVEDMISLGVAGIVLAPNDANALARVVNQAHAKKIPVVIIDSDVATDKYESFVATDNEKGGYLGGQQLAKLLGGKGKVMMLRYQEGSASTQKREEGFLKAMKENPGIEIVSSNQYGGATSDSAFAAAERLIAAQKNADGTLKVDGIFTPNESTTFGMLRALEDAKLAGKVKFVGFDASEKLVAGLNADKIHALVVQNPFNMGYLGVKTMYDLMREKGVEKRIDTGVGVVTKENINDEALRDIIKPDLDKWLK